MYKPLNKINAKNKGGVISSGSFEQMVYWRINQLFATTGLWTTLGASTRKIFNKYIWEKQLWSTNRIWEIVAPPAPQRLQRLGVRAFMPGSWGWIQIHHMGRKAIINQKSTNKHRSHWVCTRGCVCLVPGQWGGVAQWKKHRFCSPSYLL